MCINSDYVYVGYVVQNTAQTPATFYLQLIPLGVSKTGTAQR